MFKNNRYTIIIWFAFLLTPLLPSVFVYGSVGTTKFVTQQTVVPTDSLQMAKKLLENDQHKKALELSLNLLKEAKKHKDSVAIENVSFFIAHIFSKTNNYHKALEYFKKCLPIAIKQDSTVHILTIDMRIGKMFYKSKQLDSAIFWFTKIIDTEKENPQIQIIKARAYTGLSVIYVDGNSLLEAEINANKALAIHEKYTNTLSTAYALNQLGAIYLSQKKYRMAKTEFYEALAIVRNLNSNRALNLKQAIYDNVAFTLYMLRDHRAYKYQDKSFAIRDSLRNAEISGILAEIEGKYNKETLERRQQLKIAEERRRTIEQKAKKEIAQNVNRLLLFLFAGLLIGGWFFYRYVKLRQKHLKLELEQNKLIQQNRLEKIQIKARENILNATLDGKESERKMIAETLHHSVSSLLSSASLHLQASSIQLEGETPEEINKAKRIITEASNKIRNLSHSLVSSVLLKFGLAYSVQDLCEKYSNISLQFHCQCENIERFAPDFELKINSIIDELLNNIIKHSAASNAEIVLKKKKNILEINVLDDGCGFDVEQADKKSGLGLGQIQARIKKMKGTFNITTSKDNGVHIFISVPVEDVGDSES